MKNSIFWERLTSALMFQFAEELLDDITFWNLNVWVRLERASLHWDSLFWPPAEVLRTGQPHLTKIQSWCFSQTLQLAVYVAHSLYYDSYGLDPSCTLLWLNLGDCLMSGGIWAVLCPPRSGVLLEREKATSRGHLPSWSWQEKYVVNCLLWFFLKSIILWGLTLSDI